MLVRILRHVHEKNEKQCKKDDACEWVMILVEAISSLTEQVAGTYDAQPNSAALSPPNNHKYICMDRILGHVVLDPL